MSEQWAHKSHLIPRERMEDLVSRGIASRSYFIQVREVVDEDKWITDAAKQEDGAMVNAGGLTALAPAWSQEAPKVPGWYWWRWIALGHGLSVRHVTTAEMTQNGWQHGEWAGPLIVPPEGTR